jgi:hypothetical protein
MNFLSNLQKKRNKKLFDNVAKGVRKCKPVYAKKESDVVIISQVYHDALDMSLLALKSFVTHFGDCDIEVLDDGSLTDEDKSIIKSQLQGVRITNMSDVDTGSCPKGNCWERLVRILQLCESRYVIQVDTDTLTIAAIPEIVAAVKQQRAFTIGNPIFNSPVSIDYISHIASQWKGNHIQVEIERNLSRVSLQGLKEYCRGCAAFAGFPIKPNSFAELESFSQQMQVVLGKEKWNQWGSEQAASNVMISLYSEKDILPWPKYTNYGFPSQGNDGAPETFLGKCSVLHFIGSHRFTTRCYEYLANNLLENLLRKAS